MTSQRKCDGCGRPGEIGRYRFVEGWGMERFLCRRCAYGAVRDARNRRAEQSRQPSLSDGEASRFLEFHWNAHGLFPDSLTPELCERWTRRLRGIRATVDEALQASMDLDVSKLPRAGRPGNHIDALCRLVLATREAARRDAEDSDPLTEQADRNWRARCVNLLRKAFFEGGGDNPDRWIECCEAQVKWADDAEKRGVTSRKDADMVRLVLRQEIKRWREIAESRAELAQEDHRSESPKVVTSVQTSTTEEPETPVTVEVVDDDEFLF